MRTHLTHRLGASGDILTLDEDRGDFSVTCAEFDEALTEESGVASYLCTNTEDFGRDFNAALAAFRLRRDGNPWKRSTEQDAADAIRA